MKLFFTYFTPFMSFMLFSFMPPQQTPFRAGVDLVEVDVIVTDKNGEPVTGLIAADFEIRERGQPQRIDTIFLVTDDSALGSHTVPVGADPAAAPAAAPVPRRPLQPRVFVFVFDMAHLRRRGSSAPGRGPGFLAEASGRRSGRLRRQRRDARKPDRSDKKTLLVS